MFLERFRNVVQAIVNKKSQKKIGAERCTLQRCTLQFQDLCGEGGLDAEHLLLCGPPYIGKCKYRKNLRTDERTNEQTNITF